MTIFGCQYREKVRIDEGFTYGNKHSHSDRRIFYFASARIVSRTVS